MADLPPLESFPSSISPELVGQLEHSANWARTFGGSGTNLAQRHRHNQDITDYAAALVARRAEHQAQLLLTDKNAQDLIFKTQKLDLQQQEAKARMAHAQQLQPLKIKAQETQIAADLARLDAAEEASTFKHAANLQRESDTKAFHAAMNEGLAKGIKLRTPEFEDLLLRARVNAPAMASENFDDAWKFTASKLTPEEAMEQAVAKEKALTAVRAEAKAPAAEIQSLERERSLYARELSKAESRRNSANDDDTKKLADADIGEYKAKLNETESQIRARREGAPAAAPAAASERVATNPTTGEKVAFRNGAWVPLKP